jgi:hypothetical protein
MNLAEQTDRANPDDEACMLSQPYPNPPRFQAAPLNNRRA